MYMVGFIHIVLSWISMLQAHQIFSVLVQRPLWLFGQNTIKYNMLLFLKETSAFPSSYNL